MVEPALLLGARAQAAERRGAVAPVGRAIGLERIDADLAGQVHVPAWLGEQRRHVARGTFGYVVKDSSTP